LASQFTEPGKRVLAAAMVFDPFDLRALCVDGG
jgi:hypothetical protein